MTVETVGTAEADEMVGVRRAWGVVILWLAFQLSLTSLPGDMLPPLPGAFRIDWLAHFCMYFGLAFLVARVWRMSGRRTALLLLVWLGIGALGAFDEWHETFIPGRGAELMDWLMDVSGGGAGLAVGTLLMRTQWAARLLR